MFLLIRVKYQTCRLLKSLFQVGGCLHDPGLRFVGRTFELGTNTKPSDDWVKRVMLQ